MQLSQDPVLAETAAHVTTITINRPKSRNCLTRETVLSLSRQLDLVSRSPGVRCVVLRGAGEEAFCAGADLSELLSSPDPDSRRSFFGSVASLIESVHRCPVPVVSAVHGFALAGGCGLAAACDITLAADDAVFGLPETAIGLAPMVVMAPLSRCLGRKALASMALTGARLSAHEALQAGLVSRVVAKPALDAEVRRVCSDLCKQSPSALRASKAAMLDVAEREYFPFLRELADRSALLSLGAEAEEGLRAFAEKRAPSWRVEGA